MPRKLGYLDRKESMYDRLDRAGQVPSKGTSKKKTSVPKNKTGGSKGKPGGKTGSKGGSKKGK